MPGQIKAMTKFLLTLATLIETKSSIYWKKSGFRLIRYCELYEKLHFQTANNSLSTKIRMYCQIFIFVNVDVLLFQVSITLIFPSFSTNQ